jgi:microcystin degradation protein MlrC
MREFVAAVRAWEGEPDVLAVSLFPVQPWLDIPEMGFSVVVVVDGAARAATAEQRARDLALRVWDARHRFDAQLLEVDDAIGRALAGEGGPYILSESADGTGAGSPGDSVAVLERLLALGVTARCLVSVVDAPAAQAAIVAGVGSEVEVSVGGTLDPRYTRPLRIRGRVRLLFDGRYIFTGSEFTGTEGNMGPAAVVQVGSISVLVMSQPTFTIDPAFYRAVGLEPTYAKIVVVKSALQFRDNYGHFAAEQWVVDTPGPSTANLARLTWERLPRPLYPSTTTSSRSSRPPADQDGSPIGLRYERARTILS